MKAHVAAILIAPLVLAGTAQAQELRPFCPDRPGLGTPACTIDAGHAAVELGGVDWTLERDGSERTDTLVSGDLLLRYGVTDDMEVQLGWTAFGTIRTRDRATGRIDRETGTGDVTLAVRRNFAHPDGSGFSAALMPYATLPTGGSAIGAGDWSAGLIVPLSFELNDKIALQLTPEVDAAVDEDRHGRHLAYGSIVGLNFQLSEAFSSAVEVQVTRDDDSSSPDTKQLASLSLAWQPEDDLQFDVGAVAGLNQASPDLELYLGVARRF